MIINFSFHLITIQECLEKQHGKWNKTRTDHLFTPTTILTWASVMDKTEVHKYILFSLHFFHDNQ